MTPIEAMQLGVKYSKINDIHKLGELWITVKGFSEKNIVVDTESGLYIMPRPTSESLKELYIGTKALIYVESDTIKCREIDSPCEISYKMKKNIMNNNSIRSLSKSVVYLFRFDMNNSYLYKIGLTRKSAEERLSEILMSFVIHYGASPRAEIIDKIKTDDLEFLESKILNLAKKKFKRPKIKQEINGSSEFYIGDGIEDFFREFKKINKGEGNG